MSGHYELSLSQNLLAQEIISVAQRLYQKNLLASGDGNISVRLNENEIMITPSGVSKAFMQPEEMAIVTLDNQILKGNPSTERLMHLEVYKTCSKAKSVVHAHPPTAIGFSVANPNAATLPGQSLSEVILACGDIPLVPYARPSSLEMGLVLKPFLPKFRALILSRHGALTWGESLNEAWKGMERIEHSAQIMLAAQQWGQITELPEDEIFHLRELRKKLGETLL